MGIHSRDYVRDSSPEGGGYYAPTRTDSVIKYLLMANIIVFILQNLTMDASLSVGDGLSGGITDWFVLNVEHLRSFQLWRLVTYGFCHSASIQHIFFNMLLLWMFGKMVEGVLGSREFLCFYIGGIIVSGLCHVAIQVPMVLKDSDAIARGVYGASGGVMAVAMMAAIIAPRQKILFMMIIPIELRWLVLFYVVSDIFGLLGGSANGVANAAHLGGIGFGLIYHVRRWNISSWFGMSGARSYGSSPKRSNPFDFMKAFKRKPKLKIYEESNAAAKPVQPSPGDAQFDAKVDQILAKIHEQGEDSLTAEERNMLNEASRRYRDK